MPSTPETERFATLRIGGMHCGSCEILLERKLMDIKGVLGVDVNHRTGIAELRVDPRAIPSKEEVEAVIQSAGYCLLTQGKGSKESAQADGSRKWLEIGASLLIIFALYLFLRSFDLISLAPSTSGALSFGGIFLIGLIAGSSSCLAVTGGLLLAMAATYNKARQSQTTREKFRPLLSFNVGRLLGYTLLGGVVGLIGQAITITPRVTGYLNLVIAFVMLWLALSILQIVPKGLFGFRPPKRLSRWITSLAEHDHPLAPFTLGALTFFLPCGFTQSLQVVALASGSFVSGALTMGVFALGTLPSLLGISAISSTAKGSASRIFLRFAGTLVFVLALYNARSALALTGLDAASIFSYGTRPSAAAGVPAIANGVQEISMKVLPSGYEPSTLTVKAGVPVRWLVDATNASGCTSSIVIPSLNISQRLTRGQNVIEFTPPSPGRLAFSCSMGMARGSFIVQ
ncbi:MAG: sulfite exporter TauE/SafE family protein [Candidatus Peribacteraceae bacterium]